MDVMPLPKTQGREIVCSEQSHELTLRLFVLDLLVIPFPELDVGDKLRGIIIEF